MLKPHTMLLHIVKKEHTENGAIPLGDSIKMMNDFWKVAKKHGCECYIKGQKKEVLEYIPTGKTYELKTLEDIAALTADQFEMMIEDLRAWASWRRGVKELQDLGIPASTGKGMTWIDSGLHEEKIEVTITGSNKL